MKSWKRSMGWLFTMITLAIITLFCTMSAMAQEAGAATNAVAAPPLSPETTAVAAGILGSVVAALTAKFGWMVAVMSWMAILRGVFKPVMTIVESVVHQTETTKDDIILAKVEASLPWTWACWVIDLLASIKVGPQRNVPAVNSVVATVKP